MTAATSWVVSSISVWLVPAYIGAMVLIFAVPRTNRPSPAREREDEPGDSSPDEDPPAPSTVEVKEPETVDDPPPVAPQPKPRKRKVRAKKAAKGEAGSVPAAAPGPAVWVRVGPGKFVRSVAPVDDPEPAPGPMPEPIPDEEPSQDASMDQDDQPPFDEARGNEPSTPGEDLEVVPDLEADRDEEPSSAAMEFTGRRARFGLFFAASIGRPRRMVEPAAALLSRRLANVRRSGETRVRHFAEAVGGRRVNVQRDFQPRSPPARA